MGTDRGRGARPGFRRPMTQRILVAVFTVAVFLAGYGARVLTAPRQPVPPAPTAIAQEYARVSSPSTPGKKGEKSSPVDRAKLIAEIDKYRSQIESYTTQVQEIVNEFDREFTLLLTPAQREKFVANQKRRAEW